MNDNAIPAPKAMFLEGSAGSIFALYIPPASTTPKGNFLYIPPFAEEMNRCRAAAAQQARAFSRAGYGCLLLDPYGTGDSQGALEEASWDIWHQDVLTAADWIDNHAGGKITLWGFRLGALLAASVSNQNSQRFRKLLFWQPTLDGKMFITQYLRLRIAFLMDRNLPAETVESMRETLNKGETLEVSGYLLTHNLTHGIENSRLKEFANLEEMDIKWLESVSDISKPLTIGSRKLISQLESQSCMVESHGFTDAPIWQLHKRDETPNLIETTCNLFQEKA